MADIESVEEAVIVHTKDKKPVAITIYNGRPTLYLLKEADRGNVADFFEVNQMKITKSFNE